MNFWGVQNATFDENPYENERIRVILGCAIKLNCPCKTQVHGWLANTMVCAKYQGTQHVILSSSKPSGGLPGIIL